MKAIRALKIILEETVMSGEREYLEEAIKELEELIKKVEASKEYFDLKLSGNFEQQENRSCDGCKHLPTKKKHLKYECLIEVCRSCKRNINDNWEKDEKQTSKRGV